MYEILLQQDKEYYHTYHYISKNSYGQIINLKLMPDSYNKTMNYYVVFYIGKRNTGFQFMKVTGKDGLKSLIWARNCIKDFIKNIPNQPKFDQFENHNVIVQWDDNRRRNAYYYGLKPLKFYYGMVENRKSLIYKIK